MTTTVLNTKISEVENKFLIILNILLLKNLIKKTAEHFPAKLKQDDLVSKIIFIIVFLIKN